VLRQAAELKLGLPLFFQTEALDDPAVIRRAGAAAEGATYILPAKPTGAAADDFARSYRERYGKAPELFAAEAYDVVMLIFNILNASPALTPDALKDGLYRTQGYAGASGMISFDQNGDVLKPMAIKQIKDGKPVVVTTQ
jgi:branched-chain amino acid transport system substrate-binding protein